MKPRKEKEKGKARVINKQNINFDFVIEQCMNYNKKLLTFNMSNIQKIQQIPFELLKNFLYEPIGHMKIIAKGYGTCLINYNRSTEQAEFTW